MRGFKTMNNHNTKIAGMIVTAVAVVIACIQKLTGFVLPLSFAKKPITAEQTFYLCIWMVIAGMYLMVFSQEKVEDERVKKVRAGTVQIVIMLLIGVLMAFSFTSILATDLNLPGELLMLIVGFYLLAYLIIFNIGLRFDNLWNYEADDISIKENFKKNKWINVIIAIVGIIILELIFRLVL